VRREDVQTGLEASQARLEKEAAAREAFAQGQLGLDRYGLREKLEALGVRYLTSEEYEKEQA
jgi:4-hydroxy-4-methyl-2-oxoglutarate aldolase